MKIFKFAAAAIATMAVLSSCSKEGENPGASDKSSDVVIGITFGDPNTRAIEAKVADEAKAELKTAHIFFYSSMGNIYKHVYLTTDSSKPTTNIAEWDKLGDLTNETKNDLVVIKGVNNSATKCLVVLNEPANLITADMTDKQISVIEDLVINAKDFYAKAGINAVMLKGHGEVSQTDTEKTSSEGVNYTREVDVVASAIGTRVQLGKITGVDDSGLAGTSDDVVIKSFKVAGVFVNWTNSKVTLGKADGAGTYADALEVDNGQTETNYGGITDKYTTGQSGEKLADYASVLSSNTSKEVAPASGNWWGYNLIPHKGNDVPHVIVKFTEVVYTIGGGADITLGSDTNPMWITVSKYYEGTTPIAKFARNNVYSIANLDFKVSDLAELPEMGESDVRAHVTVTPWANTDVTWKPQP
jgi:hypothetical protein